MSFSARNINSNATTLFQKLRSKCIIYHNDMHPFPQSGFIPISYKIGYGWITCGGLSGINNCDVFDCDPEKKRKKKKCTIQNQFEPHPCLIETDCKTSPMIIYRTTNNIQK
jgi:hypothetical protein